MEGDLQCPHGNGRNGLSAPRRLAGGASMLANLALMTVPAQLAPAGDIPVHAGPNKFTGDFLEWASYPDGRDRG